MTLWDKSSASNCCNANTRNGIVSFFNFRLRREISVVVGSMFFADCPVIADFLEAGVVK
jgi:hypothetical protein